MKAKSLLPRIAVAAGLVAFLPLSSGVVRAAEIQDAATIRGAIEAALAPRLTTNNANIEIAVSAIDPRLQLPLCPSTEVNLPPVNSVTMTAKVSCELPHWTIYVPVRLHAWADAVVAATNLPPNRALGPHDLARGKVDIFVTSGGIVTDPQQAEGRILRAGLVVGSPILSTMLDLPIAVRRGQQIVLTASDSMIVVKTTAVALEDGRVGDHIPVQNADSQKTINATVTRDGGVEIKF